MAHLGCKDRAWHTCKDRAWHTWVAKTDACFQAFPVATFPDLSKLLSGLELLLIHRCLKVTQFFELLQTQLSNSGTVHAQNTGQSLDLKQTLQSLD
jgi:hypothetical protein